MATQIKRKLEDGTEGPVTTQPKAPPASYAQGGQGGLGGRPSDPGSAASKFLASITLGQSEPRGGVRSDYPATDVGSGGGTTPPRLIGPPIRIKPKISPTDIPGGGPGPTPVDPGGFTGGRIKPGIPGGSPGPTPADRGGTGIPGGTPGPTPPDTPPSEGDPLNPGDGRWSPRRKYDTSLPSNQNILTGVGQSQVGKPSRFEVPNFLSASGLKPPKNPNGPSFDPFGGGWDDQEQ